MGAQIQPSTDPHVPETLDKIRLLIILMTFLLFSGFGYSFYNFTAQAKLSEEIIVGLSEYLENNHYQEARA